MTDTNQLPPLPNTSKLFEDDNNIVIGYTADQMRAYALQARAQVQPAQAEVTDADIDAVTRQQWGDQRGAPLQAHRAYARAILALRPVQSGLTGCNCRWDGDTQVQWCELHLAHKEAIHEWAERAKEAEKQLALRPAAVPMTDEVFDLICNAIDKADTISMEGDYMLDSDDCIAVVRVMQALLSAHHGITAQAKKETP